MRLDYINIHEYSTKCTANTQITLDDDFNVPDSKPDIDVIVKECGNIIIDNIKINQDKANVEGTLKFSLLYTGKRANDGRHLPVKMEGDMSFRDNINLSCEADDTYVTCSSKLEDLTIKAINSRKISVKAIVELKIVCEEIKDMQVTHDIEEDEGDVNMQVLHKNIEFVELKADTRDNFRIRENVSIPANKPDIDELIWNDAAIRNFNTRLTDNGLSVNGELDIFIMYLSRDENQPVQWYETSVNFDGQLDITGCNPDMISYADYRIISKNIEARPDYDGENRDISVELVLDMNVKAYEECEENIISDVYSPVRDLKLSISKEKLKKLMIRNNSKCRVTGSVRLSEYANLLQICNSTADVQIDAIEKDEDGLSIDGAILVNVFYITSDDGAPMGSVCSVIPFNHKIQMRTDKDMEYQIKAKIEQLSAAAGSESQIEVKAVVSLDAICFQPFEIDIIKDCEVNDEISGEYANMPAMVGYISDGKERLWDIAKKYHTTTASIKGSNAPVERLADDMCVKKGEKLLLIKS